MNPERPAPYAIVTGASLISPAGRTADEAFAACLAGRAVGTPAGLPEPLGRIPVAKLPDFPEVAEAQRIWPERSAALAVLAARDALADAMLDDDWMQRERSSLVCGVSKAGAMTAIAANEARLAGTTDPQMLRRLWRWGTPACVADAVTDAIPLGGQSVSVVAACATGLAAIARGAAMIASGAADTVLVVAADATLHPLFLGSFWRMGVLAPWRDTPTDACRPFDVDRSGFVLSEGAAAIVLRAKPAGTIAARSDNRSCQDPNSVRISGWATGCQASHLVRPADSAQALATIIRSALAQADLAPDAVDLVHAHGTGTRSGDLAECQAIGAALGGHVRTIPVLSTKPATGHMLGAAGVAQVVLTVKAMQAGSVPPTANLANPDPACSVGTVQAGPIQREIHRAVCTAAGFGGTIVAIAMQLGG